MFKKFIFPAFLLWIFSCWLSHADFKENDNGRKIAEQYLESNKNDDFWENNSPRLWEWTPLYMEKDVPSYIEYEVICEKNTDCWYIIVNVDWDDVDIPIASKSDTPPTQILRKKSRTNKEELHFFYLSPFDIYSQNKITRQINAIDPQIDPIEAEEILDDMTEEEKAQTRKYIWEQKKNISQWFKNQLQQIKAYKQSDEFQKFKEQLQEYTPQYTDFYGWRYVESPNMSFPSCNSRVPCYKQFSYQYWSTDCKSWCSPVAAAIIFGYHDRNTKPKLMPNAVAEMSNQQYTPANICTMIDEIRWHMNTTCSNWQWGTTDSNVAQGIKYAQQHGYPSSYYDYYNNTTPIYTWEIDSNRPFLVNMKRPNPAWYPWAPSTIPKKFWHTAVVYGYKIGNSSQVAVNVWWWAFNYADAEVDVQSMSLWWNTYNTNVYLFYKVIGW